jgi:hypothetical protein
MLPTGNAKAAERAKRMRVAEKRIRIAEEGPG